MQFIYNILRTVLFLLVLSLAIISPVSGVGSLGVKIGDWAKFDIQAGKLNQTVSEPWMESFINETNRISWINVTVEERIGSDTIGISETTQFQNSTFHTKIYTGSVEKSGKLKYWVVPAGLEKGDLISLEEAAGNFTVQDIRFGEYGNATRRLIHGALQKHPEDDPPQMAEGYWDQETGVLCDLLLLYQGSTREHTVVVILKMAETNIWKPASNNTSNWWLGIIITTTLALIVFALVKKKGDKNRHGSYHSQQKERLSY